MSIYIRLPLYKIMNTDLEHVSVVVTRRVSATILGLILVSVSYFLAIAYGPSAVGLAGLIPLIVGSFILAASTSAEAKNSKRKSYTVDVILSR